MPPYVPVTILVVDDEPGFLKALALILRRDGATVDTADNGNLALALLQERRYDLLLCDLRMPELDGPTFYNILTSQYPYLRQRVIFLTRDILNAESMVFLERSGQPWVPKPCNAAEVRSAIAHVLQNVAEQISQHAESANFLPRFSGLQCRVYRVGGLYITGFDHHIGHFWPRSMTAKYLPFFPLLV